jgi:mycoredoxin
LVDPRALRLSPECPTIWRTTTCEEPVVTALPLPVPGSVTMFSTVWCGYCRRLKAQLQREGIHFSEVDIEQEPHHADFVMSINGGNQTVPTLLFADGSAATNPTIHEVRDRLA